MQAASAGDIPDEEGTASQRAASSGEVAPVGGVVPERTATPDVAGFPGDAPQMPHDDYAIAVGPAE